MRTFTYKSKNIIYEHPWLRAASFVVSSRLDHINNVSKSSHKRYNNMQQWQRSEKWNVIETVLLVTLLRVERRETRSVLKLFSCSLKTIEFQSVFGISSFDLHVYFSPSTFLHSSSPLLYIWNCETEKFSLYFPFDCSSELPTTLQQTSETIVKIEIKKVELHQTSWKTNESMEINKTSTSVIKYPNMINVNSFHPHEGTNDRENLCNHQHHRLLKFTFQMHWSINSNDSRSRTWTRKAITSAFSLFESSWSNI